MTVSFSKANAKLEALYSVPELEQWLTNRRKVYSFDLLSGWSCPQAKDCLSKVVQIGNSVARSKTAKIVNSVVSLLLKKRRFLMRTTNAKPI